MMTGNIDGLMILSFQSATNKLSAVYISTPRFSLHAVFFLYPLILVPVPIQLGKIASKSNKLGICYPCICNLYESNEQKIKSITRRIHVFTKSVPFLQPFSIVFTVVRFLLDNSYNGFRLRKCYDVDQRGGQYIGMWIGNF
jgi:hypothetical protein